jgi:hypothetical protein
LVEPDLVKPTRKETNRKLRHDLDKILSQVSETDLETNHNLTWFLTYDTWSLTEILSLKPEFDDFYFTKLWTMIQNVGKSEQTEKIITHKLLFICRLLLPLANNWSSQIQTTEVTATQNQNSGLKGGADHSSNSAPVTSIILDEKGKNPNRMFLVRRMWCGVPGGDTWENKNKIPLKTMETWENTQRKKNTRERNESVSPEKKTEINTQRRSVSPEKRKEMNTKRKKNTRERNESVSPEKRTEINTQRKKNTRERNESVSPEKKTEINTQRRKNTRERNENVSPEKKTEIKSKRHQRDLTQRKPNDPPVPPMTPPQPTSTQWPPEHILDPSQYYLHTKTCMDAFHKHMTKDKIERIPCAVCGLKTLRRKIETVGWDTLKSDMIDILRPSELLLHQIPDVVNKHLQIYPESHPLSETNGLLFEHKAMTYDERTEKWWWDICNNCHSHLKKRTKPVDAISNDNWYGPLPECLKDLSIAERQLISLYRVIVHITLHGSGKRDEKQRALKGHCISFSHDLEVIAQRLPRPVDDLLDTLKVCFVGSELPTKESFRWLTQIRVGKVRKALQWLIDNHIGYKDIVLNEKALEDMKMETDKIPSCLWNTLVIDQQKRKNRNEGFGDDKDDSDEDINTDKVLEPIITRSCAVNVNVDDVSEKQRKSLGLQSVVDPLNFTVATLISPHDEHPINTFGNPQFWPKGWPFLFTLGVGGPEEDKNLPVGSPKRLHTMTFDRFSQRIAKLYDDRFETDRDFGGVVWNLKQRRSMITWTRLKVQLPKTPEEIEQLSSLTSDMVEDDIEKLNKGLQFSECSLPFQKFYKLIGSIDKNLPQSDGERKGWRHEITGLMQRFGPFQVWITFTPNDIHSRIMFKFAGEKIDLSQELPCMKTSSYRRKLLVTHPAASAMFFHTVVKAFIESMLGYNTKCTKGLIPGPIMMDDGILGGILGPLDAFYGAVEQQGRLSLHLHLTAWLKNIPRSDKFKELLEQPEWREQFFKFLDIAVKEGFDTMEKDFGCEFTDPPHNKTDKGNTNCDDDSVSDTGSVSPSSTDTGTVPLSSTDTGSVPPSTDTGTVPLSSTDTGSVPHSTDDETESPPPPCDKNSSILSDSDSDEDSVEDSHDSENPESDPQPSILTLENAPKELRCTFQTCNGKHFINYGSMTPPDSSDPSFFNKLVNDVHKIVSKVQCHTCSTRCFKKCKPGCTKICCAGYGTDNARPIVPETHINEKGELAHKRTHPTVNNYHPVMISCLRCNMDIKLIFSGTHARSIVYYITDYQVKKQLSTFSSYELFMCWSQETGSC